MKADSSLKVTELQQQVAHICFNLFLTFSYSVIYNSKENSKI